MDIRLSSFSYIFSVPQTDGKFWDFTSDLAKGDKAYTTLALGAHTDNTYFVRLLSLYRPQTTNYFILFCFVFHFPDRPLRPSTLPPALTHQRDRRRHTPRRRVLRRLHHERAPSQSI